MRARREGARPREGVRVGALVIGAGVAGLALAFAGAGDYTLYVLALVVIQGIAFLSLNLLMGYAGQVSLGQAALVGMGAFGAAELGSWGLPFPLTIPAAALLSAGIATVVGLPSLRIRGLQVAATTLAFGVTAEHLIFVRPWDAGAGRSVAVARPAIVAGGRNFLLLAVGGLVAVLLLDRAVRGSRVGRAFFAVRDREDTAAARGINVGRTKLLAYAVSGLYAGIAGALVAYLLEAVTPETFTVWVSLGYVAAVVVGGLGSWRGALVAGIAFTGLPELLRPAAGYAPLAGAVMLMLVPTVRPEGLGWLLDRRLGSFVRRASRGRASPGVPTGDAAAREAAEAVVVAPRRPISLTVPIHSLLSAEDVAVSFGGVAALQGVGIEVLRGEIVGLIGPNGAGKTTFFNCLSGFVRPDRGRITYRGRDLLALDADARPSLGIVRTFQQVGLCGPQTVRENIMIAQHGLATYGVVAGLARAPSMRRAEATLRARADAAIEICDLGAVADEKVSALSYGTQRLAEVAAAIAMGPELLLLDEPFAGMGHEESALLADRLLELHARLHLTLLVIEHDVPLIAALSSYLYVFAEGRVLAHGDPRDVQADPDVVSIYLGEPRESAMAGA